MNQEINGFLSLLNLKIEFNGDVESQILDFCKNIQNKNKEVVGVFFKRKIKFIHFKFNLFKKLVIFNKLI